MQSGGIIVLSIKYSILVFLNNFGSFLCLPHCNLSQVQYMAFHKYVSNTKQYQLNNLDKLQKNRKISSFNLNYK